MNFLKALVLLFIFFGCFQPTNAQLSPWALSGHVQYLESVWVPKQTDNWQTWQTLNNRLNFDWYPSNSLTLHAGMRNLFYYGQLIQQFPDFSQVAGIEDGYLDLTHEVVTSNSYYMISNFDRLYAEYMQGDLLVSLGRQRVNWGMNLVWTPNDIFNVFSYLDFDYVERPGCDALRMQYYTGVTSSVQFAIKIDADERTTWAAMYKFNKWFYDFQVFSGMMRDDFVAGAGWAGQIGDAGFNGEMTYFHPTLEDDPTPPLLLASAGVNYTFENSFYLHGAALFNSNGTLGNASLGNLFTVRDLNVKTLTRARYSLFGKARYNFTPLITGNIACIFNPGDKSFYLSPNVDISLTQDIGLLIIAQLFYGDDGTEYGDYGKMIFGRLKYNF